MGDHTEAFQVDFDPARLSYSDLLDLFWASHQPDGRSYSRQYMAALFYDTERQQQQQAVESRDRVASRMGKKVLTTVAPLGRFYRAEDYHQKYYLRNHQTLMSEFRNYSDREFTDSTVAARINGYIARKGSAGQLAEEIESFGLSSAGRKTLELLYRPR